MPYRVKHYVTYGGTLYRAGDILPDSVTEEDTKWLLDAGAVEEMQRKEEKPRENKRRKNKPGV